MPELVTDIYNEIFETTSHRDARRQPVSYDDLYQMLEPNGFARMMILIANRKPIPVKTSEYYYRIDQYGEAYTTLTGIYRDQAMSVAYTGGTGVTNDVLYIKMPARLAVQSRKNKQATLRNEDDCLVDMPVVVVGNTEAGDNSQVAVRLLKDDTAGDSGLDLSDATIYELSGFAMPEGSALPDGLIEEGQKVYNQTSIDMEALSFTGSAQAQVYDDTGREYDYQKMKALKRFQIGRETSAFTSYYHTVTGDNGHTQRFSNGILEQLKTYGVVKNFKYDTDYAGSTWAAKGEEYIEHFIQQIYIWGNSPNRMCWVGNQAMFEIQQLVKGVGTFNFSAATNAYGIKINKWVTAFGDLYLQQHPLFSRNPALTRTMVVFDINDLRQRVLGDRGVKFVTAKMKNDIDGALWYDGKKDGWYVEDSFDITKPQKGGILQGIGEDNVV